jgi:hypothetical protein
MFPFSQHQKTPGRAEEGGFRKAAAISMFAFSLFPFHTEQESNRNIETDK